MKAFLVSGSVFYITELGGCSDDGDRCTPFYSSCLLDIGALYWNDQYGWPVPNRPVIKI